MKFDFTIDGSLFELEVEGEFFKGENQVLFEERGNILENCSWLNEGYSTLSILDELEFDTFKTSIGLILEKILEENNVTIDNKFSLETYHHYVTSNAVHQAVIEKTRFLTFKDFNVDIEKVVERISVSVNRKLGKTNPKLLEEIIILRINRPESLDINPFHRDGYLDIWADTLNVWIPIAGCNSVSSLPLIPKSHFWNEQYIIRTEAKGASINGLSYHVPAIINYKDGLHAIRPNPKYGEALLFTPFIVHGAALNKQKDITRVSLELRLCSIA